MMSRLNDHTAGGGRDCVQRITITMADDLMGEIDWIAAERGYQN